MKGAKTYRKEAMRGGEREGGWLILCLTTAWADAGQRRNRKTRGEETDQIVS